MQKTIKRLIDFTAAGFALVTLWPVFFVVGALVHWRLGSPVLFTQERIGKDEKPFTLIKFRTMLDSDAPDAERLTPFGKFLRATSLDELPQLWNIFVGDMSFVGPRPLLPRYLPFYTPRETLRHTVRPGVTGLAQVSGRNGLSWNERLELDAQYVERFSLALDLEILWRTIMVVLARKHVNAKGHVTMHALDEERKHTV